MLKEIDESKSGPIQAKDVQTRNQIDMTDMGFKDTVIFKDKQCKYILTAVDVFKRIIFLLLLKGKSKRTVQQT